MSKELKAPDKVTQKMTRDGAIAENLTTGETTSISERPPEENYSAPAAGAAEKATQRISTEVSRHLEKGAEKKSLDAAQLKTHTSRLQFSEAERATPELQKAIKKSDTAADRLDKARAAIPKQTKIKKERVFDEAKGKAKTRLAFEKTDKPPNGKLRHRVNVLRAVLRNLDNLSFQTSDKGIIFGFGVANDNVVGRDKKSVCDFAFCRKTFAAARCAEYQAVGVFQLLSVAQNHVVGKGV